MEKDRSVCNLKILWENIYKICLTSQSGAWNLGIWNSYQYLQSRKVGGTEIYSSKSIKQCLWFHIIASLRWMEFGFSPLSLQRQRSTMEWEVGEHYFVSCSLYWTHKHFGSLDKSDGFYWLPRPFLEDSGIVSGVKQKECWSLLATCASTSERKANSTCARIFQLEALLREWLWGQLDWGSKTTAPSLISSVI
jgi:hypothetical protein